MRLWIFFFQSGGLLDDVLGEKWEAKVKVGKMNVVVMFLAV